MIFIRVIQIILAPIVFVSKIIIKICAVVIVYSIKVSSEYLSLSNRRK